MNRWSDSDLLSVGIVEVQTASGGTLGVPVPLMSSSTSGQRVKRRFLEPGTYVHCTTHVFQNLNLID